MMNFDEIVVKESPGLCRCCLSEGCYKDMGTEYSWMTETEVYADMLLECFDISISQHSEGPNGPNRLICEVCITRLRDACNFKKQVVDSEKRFIDMLARGEFKQQVMIYQTQPQSLKEEHLQDKSDPDGEVEYLEDVDFDDIDDIPLTKLPSEPSSLEQAKPSRKRGRPKKSTTEQVAKKTDKPKVKVNRGAKLPGDKDKKLDMARKQLLKRRNVQYVLQYSNVTPFLWDKSKFRCFYCMESIKDPTFLRDHTASVHQFANLELAVYDRMKNTRDKDAAIKIDVANLACKVCQQSVANLDQLIHHLIIAHDAEYDMSVQNCFLPFILDKDQPTCPSCNMKFVFFEYLLRHANKHHLSHDYMCDVCGTSFQGDNHLRMHNRYYHREGGYHCDICGVALSTLSKKLLHEKNVHLVNLSTCPHCNETFKSTYSKKQHLANVHGVEELKIKCKFCPRVFPQESIMSRHMRRVHLKEKNVECEVCNEKFFSSYEVKLHMMRHTKEKKFVCFVCGKNFAKKCNLDAHHTKHNREAQLTEKDAQYVCNACKAEFTNEIDFNDHVSKEHVLTEEQAMEGIIDDISDMEVVQLEFIGDELEGAEITGQYIQ